MRLCLLAAALLRALFGHALGFFCSVQGATVEHDLADVAGFGPLLDLVVRDDPTHVDQALFLVDLLPAQRRHFTRAHTGIETMPFNAHYAFMQAGKAGVTASKHGPLAPKLPYTPAQLAHVQRVQKFSFFIKWLELNR